MVNSANAQVLVDYFEKFPEKHLQDNWVTVDNSEPYLIETVENNFCGTRMCVAGAAVYLLTDRETFKDCLDGEKRWTHVAADVLGIDNSSASQLFYTMNNDAALGMLRAIAEDDMGKFRKIYRSNLATDG